MSGTLQDALNLADNLRSTRPVHPLITAERDGYYEMQKPGISEDAGLLSCYCVTAPVIDTTYG